MANYNPKTNQMRDENGMWVRSGAAPRMSVGEHTVQRALATADAIGAGYQVYKVYRQYGPTVRGAYQLSKGISTHLPTGIAAVDKALRRKNG